MSTRRVLQILLLIEFVLVVLIARQWAYVTTYRLFLEHAIAGTRSASTQQFDIDRNHVVPRIVARTSNDCRLRAPIAEPVTVEAELQATKGPVRYHGDLARRPQTRRPANRRRHGTDFHFSRSAVQDGRARARDGRTRCVDRRPSCTRHAPLGSPRGFAFSDVGLSRRDAACVTTRPRHAGVMGFRAVAVSMTIALALLVCELTLRAMGDRGPAGVLAQRRDLGEVWPDERWENSPGYGRRLRALVDTENAWQYGDIVRMGLPRPLSREPRHSTPLPLQDRRGRLPERPRPAARRHRRARRFIYRRTHRHRGCDPGRRAFNNVSASPCRTRHGGFRTAAGTSRAAPLRHPAPSVDRRARVLRRQRPLRRGAVRPCRARCNRNTIARMADERGLQPRRHLVCHERARATSSWLARRDRPFVVTASAAAPDARFAPRRRSIAVSSPSTSRDTCCSGRSCRRI